MNKKIEDPLLRIISSFGIDRIFAEPEWIITGKQESNELPEKRKNNFIRKNLKLLRADVGDCMKCKLSEGRNMLVFGGGNPEAGILFIGEAPGSNEDRTGLPFVGRAGKLLDRILNAISLDRNTVYITNILKCRPPNNRTPSSDEVSACFWILEEQIRVMKPGIICALGASAARTLTGSKNGIGQLRGKALAFMGIPLIATYHPAALLRSPALKRPVWDDMQKMRDLMIDLGLPRKTEV